MDSFHDPVPTVHSSWSGYDTGPSERILQERSSNPQQEITGIDYRERPNHGNESSQSLRTLNGSTTNNRRSARRSLTNGEQDYLYRYVCEVRKQCEAYQKYRDGQAGKSEETQNKASQVWPDRFEDMFWRALIHHPYVERKKAHADGTSKDSKQFGRNELMAKFMTTRLGEDVNKLLFTPNGKPREPRKVVSSHLQVLRKFFKGFPDKSVIRVLGEPQSREQKARRARRRACNLSTTMSRSRYKMATQLETFSLEPQDFHMYIRVPGSAERTPIHTFTQSRRGATLFSKYLEEVPQWDTRFPCLQNIIRGKTLVCDVIHAHASLTLLDILPSDKELCIDCFFSSRESPQHSDNWHCTIKFYENDRSYSSELNQCEPLGDPAEIITNSINHVDDGSKRIYQVPFGSSYWAKKFSQISLALRKAESEGSKDDPYIAANRIRDHVGNITAVQEIYDFPLGATQGMPPSLVVIWTFHQAFPHEQGAVTWQRLERNMFAPEDFEENMDESEFVPGTSTLEGGEQFPSLNSSISQYQPIAFDFNSFSSNLASQEVELSERSAGGSSFTSMMGGNDEYPIRSTLNVLSTYPHITSNLPYPPYSRIPTTTFSMPSYGMINSQLHRKSLLYEPPRIAELPEVPQQDLANPGAGLLGHAQYHTHHMPHTSEITSARSQHVYTPRSQSIYLDAEEELPAPFLASQQSPSIPQQNYPFKSIFNGLHQSTLIPYSQARLGPYIYPQDHETQPSQEIFHTPQEYQVPHEYAAYANASEAHNQAGYFEFDNSDEDHIVAGNHEGEEYDPGKHGRSGPTMIPHLLPSALEE